MKNLRINNVLPVSFSWLIAIGTFALVMGIGCKPPAASTTQNVDGIMSNSLNSVNRIPCGPTGMAYDTPENALIRAYASLPPQMRSNDPASSMRTHYRLVPDANVYCAPHFAQNAGKYDIDARKMNFESCWISEKGADGKSYPVIILKSTPQAIHSNLIRATTYAVMEFYVDQQLVPAIQKVGSGGTADDVKLISAVQSLVQLRKQLTDSLVSDLTPTAKGKPVIDSAMKVFRAGSVDALKANVDYQNFLLAETMDTMYCAPETNRCANGSNQCFDQNGLSQTKSKIWPIMMDLLGTPWFGQ